MMANDQVTVAGRWFRTVDPRPGATARLFLFPHGGGSAAMYSRWSALLPAGVELVLVQLPGRHDRFNEPAYTTVEPLVAALHEVLLAELDGRPYAFFGHSMGAMLAYRLTVALQHSGDPAPVLLGVSSWAPGGSRPGAELLAGLTDDQLVREVREVGALPAAIRDDPEMLRYVLPTLRADLSVYADYTDEPGEDARPACPVVAYGSGSDPLLVPGAMTAWAARSRTFLGLSEFPGDHFYLDEHATAVAADLARHLRRALAGRSGTRL